MRADLAARQGGAATGLGGTAPRPPANPAVWLLLIVAGILVAAAGGTGLARPRRGGVTALRTGDGMAPAAHHR
jgi:hypothetical protein